MPCCPVLLSVYRIVIVSLNEMNGDGDGDGEMCVCVCVRVCVCTWPALLLQHDQEEQLGELHRRERLQEDRLLSSTSRVDASCLDTPVELLL